MVSLLIIYIWCEARVFKCFILINLRVFLEDRRTILTTFNASSRDIVVFIFILPCKKVEEVIAKRCLELQRLRLEAAIVSNICTSDEARELIVVAECCLLTVKVMLSRHCKHNLMHGFTRRLCCTETFLVDIQFTDTVVVDRPR